MSADARRSTFLAFDLGASSGRAILGWIDDGRIQIEELHRFPTPLVQEGDRLYWDVDALWEELRTGLAKARARDGLLRSLSVDSWGVDYVPLDADGVPVRRAASYRDPRAVGMLARATERVSKEEIYRTTGIQFMEINTLYQVLADALLDPDVYARTHSRLLIADYFNTRFSGIARAERSLASTTQLMHASEGRWATEMMDALGIGGGEWPPIMDSGTRLGPAREAPEVTVLAGCSHDTACAVAAVPALPDTSDWAYLSCGTWSLLGVELSAPLLTDAAREAGFTNEAGIDGTTRFLKNMTGLWILQECERVWHESGDAVPYETLVAEAAAAEPPADLLDVRDPAFSARGDMPQLIREYCRERGIAQPANRGALVRLILESLADGHRRTLEELESVLGRRIETIYLVGGGSRNELLCRLTADRCRRRVVAGPAEATALGNLLVQARAMGDLRDASIRDVVRASVELRTYEPEGV